jgi:GAF domain-containing protein
VLTALVTRAAALADSPACTVSLVDEAAGEAVLAAQVGLPEGTPPGLRVPLALPIIRRSLETGEPIILPDTYGRDAPEMRQVLVHPGVRAFFGFPMVRQGRTMGFMTLSSLTPRTPSAQEIAAYQLLAERAAAALENARLYRGLEESKAALEARVRDLERFTKHAVGRELMMKELKERIRELEAKASEVCQTSEV